VCIDKFATKNRCVIKGKYKGDNRAVLEGGKDVYIWPICQPIIEVSSRAIIKATMKSVLDGCRHAYIWPNLQRKIEVTSSASIKATIELY
jgi:hypothetical protein